MSIATPLPPPPPSPPGDIFRYPPVLDAELDSVDAGLSTVKTQTLGGVEGGEGGGDVRADGEEEEEEEHQVLPTSKEERRIAKKKLKENEKRLKVWVIAIITVYRKPELLSSSKYELVL